MIEKNEPRTTYGARARFWLALWAVLALVGAWPLVEARGDVTSYGTGLRRLFDGAAWLPSYVSSIGPGSGITIAVDPADSTRALISASGGGGSGDVSGPGAVTTARTVPVWSDGTGTSLTTSSLSVSAGGVATFAVAPTSLTTGSANEAWGDTASAADNSVAVGYGAVGGDSVAHTSATAVGMLTSVRALAGTGVGRSAAVTGAYGVALGSGAAASADYAIGIGYGSLASGAAIVMAPNYQETVARRFVVGSNDLPIDTMIVGESDTNASPLSLLVRGTNATQNNTAAGNLSLQPGLSTGNATPGYLAFLTGAAGSSGATLQTAAERARIESTQITTTVPTRATSGTLAAPAYSFSADSDTGMYWAGLGGGVSQLALVADGTTVQIMSSLDVTHAVRTISPSQNAAVPNYTFITDGDTGVFNPAANTYAISTGGTERIRWDTANTTSTLLELGPAGAAATPAYSFSGDTNTGLYSVGADQLGIATGGTLRTTVSTTETTQTLPTRSASGSASSPAYSFTSATNSGLYNSSGSNVAIAVGGVAALTIAAADVTAPGHYSAATGTAGGPAYVFIGDSNTGLWSPGADRVSLATGGVARLEVNTAGDVLANQGSNGQAVNFRSLTEAHTLAAAATSDTTIQIPASSYVYFVTVRVTTTITGCASLDVGVSGATTRYASGLALTAGTTSSGIDSAGPRAYTGATAVRLSCTGGAGAFGAGAVRVTIHYLDATPPTT